MSGSVEGPSSLMAHQLSGDLAVFLALKNFLADLRGHHILIHSDNTVSLHKSPGGFVVTSTCKLACQIPLWSQGKSLSLWAAYIPGVQNIGADILSRQGLRPREWRFHPRCGADMEAVWPGTSGSVWVSRDVSLSTLVLPHASSSSRTGHDGRDLAKAFPRLLCSRESERVCRDQVLLLLIAPRWPGRVWFPDIIPSRRASSGALRQEGHFVPSRGLDISPSTRTVETVGLASEGALLIDSGLSVRRGWDYTNLKLCCQQT